MRTGIALSISAAGLLAACGDNYDPASQGNADLRIASFQVQETGDRLLIVGLDAVRREVAKVEVLRGPFTINEAFAEDRVGDARNVDGRRTHVWFGTDEIYHETEGYTSLHMPWPHNTPAEIKEFVADSHVAPLLARWNVAFKADLTPTAEAGEEPYARN